MQAAELVGSCQRRQLPAREVTGSPRFRSVLVSVKHPNIVRLVDWAEVELKEGKFGVLLLENCSKGYAWLQYSVATCSNCWSRRRGICPNLPS